MAGEKLLEIKDLEVCFKTEQAMVYALNGINLTINSGESLGLVGESGAGKTTTALGILNLLSQNAIVKGDVLFHPVSDISEVIAIAFPGESSRRLDKAILRTLEEKRRKEAEDARERESAKQAMAFNRMN